ncbi:NBR1-Ig-like domain-containing protein [Spirillospora sp. CA-253888]
MRARTEAVAEFAAALRELRNSVGNPSFREMSGRSGAISHTTLHEATKGNRLPSWGTTAEFVKACGADPEDYRERWEQANLTVRSGRPTGELVVAVTEPQAVRVEPVVFVPEGRRRLRPALPVAAGLGVVLVGTVVVGVVFANRDSEAEGRGPSASPAASSVGCPVPPPRTAAAPPAHRGDAAQFITDVTLPDCTRVRGGRTVTKVWRLKNAGTVRWKGYSLLRLDIPQRVDQCRTETHVPIEDTRPGGTVDIRTDVTTPSGPGLCYVRFKMMDASGKVAFPGSRPVNFQIIVQ